MVHLPINMTEHDTVLVDSHQLHYGDHIHVTFNGDLPRNFNRLYNFHAELIDTALDNNGDTTLVLREYAYTEMGETVTLDRPLLRVLPITSVVGVRVIRSMFPVECA